MLPGIIGRWGTFSCPGLNENSYNKEARVIFIGSCYILLPSLDVTKPLFPFGYSG
jgi:hypothetical protein